MIDKATSLAPPNQASPPSPIKPLLPPLPTSHSPFLPVIPLDLIEPAYLVSVGSDQK